MMCVETNAKIKRVNVAALQIIYYGDPRLEEVCTPVDAVDESVRALVERMFELMFAASGVGLAAAQVGVTVRLFVASPTVSPADRHVYINPEIIAVDGWQDGEEGCLSFPGMQCRIKRRNTATIRATNLDGETFEETAEALAARIIQHEMDHLEGRLLVDRMGSVARLAHRMALNELRQRHAEAK